jgi:thiamine biosynthesis lipoprotein
LLLGAEHGLVDLAGDIRVIGPHPSGEAWRISIRDPRLLGKLMATAAVERGSLATSGDYERCIEFNGKRYLHILCPRTGSPVSGLASVTAMTDRCLVASSVCTIAMLKGLAGIDWLNSLGIDHFSMNEEGRHYSAGPFNADG